ncbi:MAG: formyltransferase family protein [Candidatus Erginobacter occultus]|nr:formyltransferase family protein [Candidatus Erginobacter occultus]
MNVIALCELLSRDGHLITGLCIVSPFRLRRLRSLIRRRGFRAVIEAFKRMSGAGNVETEDADLIAEFRREENLRYRSLKSWCRDRGVPYLVVPGLNVPAAIDFLQNTEKDAVIYGGGGIIRKDFLQAADHWIINAHSGPLPEIRGMNACEWSVLLNLAPAVTIHYINEGIDTGPVILRLPVTVEIGDTAKSLRTRCVIEGIRGIRSVVASPGPIEAAALEDADRYRQCFMLAPVLREILERKLARLEAAG